MFRLIFILLISISLCTDYYVRTDGHDTASGLNNTNDPTDGAWLTVGKAATVADDDDIVHIADGTYAAAVTISISGSSGHPVTYTGSTSAWISRKVTITASYILIDGLRFGDPTSVYGLDTHAIDVYGDYNVIENCLFDPDNTIAHTYSNMIIKFFSGADHNTLQNFEGRDMNGDENCINTAVGTTYNTVKNGVIHDCWDIDVLRPFGTHQTFQNLEVYNILNGGGAQHMDFWQLFSTGSSVAHDILIENCYVHDTQTDICYTSNVDGDDLWGVTMRNNVFENMSIYAHFGIDSCKVYNNIFYDICSGCGYGGAMMEIMGFAGYPCNGFEVCNNVFLVGSTNHVPWYLSTPGLQWTHTNNYYGVVGSYAPWAKYKNYQGYFLDITESNMVAGGDPCFTNIGTGDFSITELSVLKDAGTTIASFSVDKIGTSRPQGSAWDIGAYEYGTSEPVSNVMTIFRIGDISYQ